MITLRVFRTYGALRDWREKADIVRDEAASIGDDFIEYRNGDFDFLLILPHGQNPHERLGMYEAHRYVAHGMFDDDEIRFMQSRVRLKK